ncbi:uncharacterized protein LOC131254761 isoform X2 [Magnolia sinica]|uniref:uncharacterized protein LOC131254761 isoform X2 n=1 Tax=Magnolia sinica TaxID=86752 RepID=UPI002658EA14|nr:uncharacterized protein LOC131254761 isoform X2 [Magnolia sinica]
MSEKERAFWKREFGNYGLENAGSSINSSSSYATSNLSHCSSISEKESEADERISGLNRVGKESDMALETMPVVPYLGNETSMTVGSTHSHEKAIVCGASHEGKVGSRLDEVKRLSRRLELLEEDTQLLKKVFVQKVEERHELLNEISQNLQAIQEHLTLSNIKDKSLKINSIINAIKRDHCAGVHNRSDAH